MDNQHTDNKLIKSLKQNCDKNINFINEVASVLDINYDAAYRRINNKTAISLKDAIKLTKHFNVSLSKLYNYQEGDKVLMSKTKEIKNAVDLENYFLQLTKTLMPLKKANSSMLYSAKDLPLFYVLKNNLLSKFKLYVWLYILDKNVVKKKISFEKFHIPLSLQQAALRAGKAYENINITEIWNYGIINSIINQISYFFETKLLQYNDAIRICEDLRKTIQGIEKTSLNGFRENNIPYKLYHNELLILNNNILIKVQKKKTLISPYSLLRYYLIKDQKTCNAFDEFITTQIGFSKLLSNAGLKANILFFKPKYNRIDKLLQRIELVRQFPLT